MRIESRVTAAIPASEAWERLVDWPRHSGWIPLTKVWITKETGGVGTRFVGRTGIGRLAFDDPMEVTHFEPPQGSAAGYCEVVKQGWLVSGTAGFTVFPQGSGCEVVWFEEIEIRPRWLFRLFSPLVIPVGAGQFRGVLTRALAVQG